MRRISLLVIIVLSVSSCGSGGLSDEDLADEGAQICGEFAIDYQAAANELRLREVYHVGPAFATAAAAFGEFEFDAESAPLTSDLVSALTASADAWDAFHAALQPALDATDAPMVQFMITENGNVWLMENGSIFETQATDVDPNLFLEVKATEAEVETAATAADLGGCVPDWPVEENG